MVRGGSHGPMFQFMRPQINSDRGPTIAADFSRVTGREKWLVRLFSLTTFRNGTNLDSYIVTPKRRR